MTGYIYSRQGLGLVERRLEDARERRRQGDSPLLLGAALAAGFAGLCLAARLVRMLFGGANQHE